LNNDSIFNQYVLKYFNLVVNTTPVGTFPNVKESPKLPYQFLDSKHLCYDLVYNPEKTCFLAKAEAQGAAILNGYRMLLLQAERSWDLWNFK